MNHRLARSIAILIGLFATLGGAPALAHSGKSHGDGRIPGRPDFQRLGDVEIEFHPRAGAYTYKHRSGEPAIWFHVDVADALTGGHYALPATEEPVICATSGHRIKIMYSTSTDPYTPTPQTAAEIRSDVRRLNGKIISESLRSSGNTKALRMRVDCDASGEIKIYSFPHPTGESGSLFYWAYMFYGSPGGSDSVKNLIFYDGPDPNKKAAGVGEYSNSSVKSPYEGPPVGNPNCYQTKSAVVYSDYWDTHAAVHELFHTMGAVQDDAPYSTEGFHCWTGIDVMCYDDDEKGPVTYTEAFCPANGFFDSSIGDPIDCNYDSYFDAQEESGEWLNTHWNVAGAENPFLVEQPTPASPGVTVSPVSVTGPGAATISGTITPNGLPTQFHFEYGGTSSYGSKVPVPDAALSAGLWGSQQTSYSVSGLQPDTAYHYRLVATNTKGTSATTDHVFTTPSWALNAPPNPGTSGNYLYTVACEPSSTTQCTAVGTGSSAGVDKPIALRWNGSSWSSQSPALKSGATHTRLLGIDCPSDTRCIAVGNSEPSGGPPASLGELWNENKWSVQATPLPAGASAGELTAVGCNSTANCTAVGSAVIGGVKTALVEKWKSPTWAAESIPIPAGATSSQLDGVDCRWSNFCVAVGRYTTSSGVIKSLALLWDGSWSLQALPEPVEAIQGTLLDVSCTATPNVCTATGGWKNSGGNQFALAYRFGGSSWALQAPPSPAGSIGSVLQDVSCESSASCTAVGSWVSTSGGPNKTLAEIWNGTTWSIQGTMNPTGATFAALFGSSCRGSDCIAVGWSTNSAGVNNTLAEIR